MENTTKPSWSYWVVAVLGLVWSGLGCLNYIVQANPAAVAEMPEAYQQLIATRPAWATAAFALAVFGGVLGCALLLVRRRWAIPVLTASLVGVAGTMLQALMATGFSSQVLLGTGMSLVIAVILLIVGHAARSNGWLR